MLFSSDSVSQRRSYRSDNLTHCLISSLPLTEIFPDHLNQLSLLPNISRWFLNGPKWFLDGPKWFPNGPKWFPIGPKWFTNGLKGFPSSQKWFKNCFKCSHMIPNDSQIIQKKPPKRSQKTTTIVSNCLKSLQNCPK